MVNRNKVDWDSLSEEQQWDIGEDVVLQDIALDELAGLISSGKNVSPRLVAKCLRGLIDVDIPSEILEYAADLLDGKRRRGRPVSSLGMSTHEVRSGFKKADYDELRSKGVTAAESMLILARRMTEGSKSTEDDIERVANRISTWVYPRKLGRGKKRGSNSPD
jgi:hypothetical protein